MQCIKTGCTAYLEDYEEYIHGDLFELKSGQYLMRVCWRGHEPPRDKINIRVLLIEHWFDDGIKHSTNENSTLLIRAHSGLSYEGKLITESVTALDWWRSGRQQ